MQKEEKSKRKYFHKISSKRYRFFRKFAYSLAEKNNGRCWACGEVRHYANECKNKCLTFHICIFNPNA